MRTTCFVSRLWLPGLLIPVLLAPVRGASAEPAGAIEITWPRLVDMVDAHPAIAAGNLQIDAARGGVGAAGAVPNPVVEATVGQGIERTGGASGVEWGLSLTMPFDWVSGRGARISEARAEVDVAVAESAALRRDVISQLRMLFWNLAYEQANVESLSRLVDETATLVDAVKRRVETGEARPVELTRIEIELQNVTADLEAAGMSLSARQAEMGLWIGAAPGASIVVAADMETLPLFPDRETALAMVREAHPAIAAANARERYLEAGVTAETLARVPSFSVTGFGGSELDKVAWGFGVAMDLPLWNWNNGRIDQARARLAAGRGQAVADVLELDMSVVDAQSSCAAAVGTAARFRDDIVPRSEAVAATMEKTYFVGEAGLFELIDARRTLLDSRRGYLGALARARVECGRLDGLIGEESR